MGSRLLSSPLRIGCPWHADDLSATAPPALDGRRFRPPGAGINRWSWLNGMNFDIRRRFAGSRGVENPTDRYNRPRKFSESRLASKPRAGSSEAVLPSRPAAPASPSTSRSDVA